MEIELLRNIVKKQLIYDELKTYHYVELDKIVNCFARREPLEEIEFYEWEKTITVYDFEEMVGPFVVQEIERYFVNLDFSHIEDYANSLSDENIIYFVETMNSFRYPEAQNVKGFSYSMVMANELEKNHNVSSGMLLTRAKKTKTTKIG